MNKEDYLDVTGSCLDIALDYAEHATKDIEELQNKINKAIDKLYCWGETLDPDFQKEMLEILGENNE